MGERVGEKEKTKEKTLGDCACRRKSRLVFYEAVADEVVLCISRPDRRVNFSRGTL